MTDLDLEAIKARAGSMLGDLEDFGVCYWNPREAGEELLRVVAEVERLRTQNDLAYQAGRLVERGEIFESEDE